MVMLGVAGNSLSFFVLLAERGGGRRGRRQITGSSASRSFQCHGRLQGHVQGYWRCCGLAANSTIFKVILKATQWVQCLWVSNIFSAACFGCHRHNGTVGIRSSLRSAARLPPNRLPGQLLSAVSVHTAVPLADLPDSVHWIRFRHRARVRGPLLGRVSALQSRSADKSSVATTSSMFCRGAGDDCRAVQRAAVLRVRARRRVRPRRQSNDRRFRNQRFRQASVLPHRLRQPSLLRRRSRRAAGGSRLLQRATDPGAETATSAPTRNDFDDVIVGVGWWSRDRKQQQSGAA